MTPFRDVAEPCSSLAGWPESSTRHFVVPEWLWLVTGFAAVVGLFTANPELTALSVLLVPCLVALLWRPGEPPVLLFACLMQWLQASALIFYQNVMDVRIADDYLGTQLSMATALSLVGVGTLAVGMRISLLGLDRGHLDAAARELLRLSPQKLFLAYLFSFLVTHPLRNLAFSFPGITQPVLAIISMKWVLLFLLGWTVMTQRKDYSHLTAGIVLEVVVGLFGYFSTFKSVLFLLIILFVTCERQWLERRLRSTFVVAMAIVLLALVWTAIKSDYREFLNQGTGQQVVLAPMADRAAKLYELTSNVGFRQFADALDQGVRRLSYVTFFAHALTFVPEALPHERGKLWWSAIQHVTMPRILFPDKPAVHDSLRTRQYTGLDVAGPDQGTSIGLGYMAESYIDFGPFLMFFPILLLGMIYGGIYRLLTNISNCRSLGFSMATALLAFSALLIESSNVKLLGGVLTGLIIYVVLGKTCGNWLMMMMLDHRPETLHDPQHS